MYAVGPEFKLLGQNSLASEGADFSSTPAISDGELFVRSSKYLYCIAEPNQGRVSSSDAMPMRPRLSWSQLTIGEVGSRPKPWSWTSRSVLGS